MKRLTEVVHDEPWRHQVYQNDLALNADENYMLTFWARTDNPQTVRVSTKNSQPPWAFTGLRNEVDVSYEWQQYEVNFTANDDTLMDATRLTFNYGGAAAGTIWIADVSLRSESATDEENLIFNPRFEDELDGWVHEGTKQGEFEVQWQTLFDANAEGSE